MTQPQGIWFSSGPCAKFPGWSLDTLSSALVGRSHRSPEGLARIRLLLERTHKLLALPDDYVIGLLPGSATGAFEAAMWNLLGPRPATVLAWDVFGALWADDVVHHLKHQPTEVRQADPGLLPCLRAIDPHHDIVMPWNGTTTGVCLPDADWISDTHDGLVLCDATSAIFGMPIPMEKMDVVAFSWQKCLGGEAAHGMLILSPRARHRLATHTPAWPVPRLLRLANHGKSLDGLWRGETLNTPSMLCVEDCLRALDWAEAIGGLPALIARTQQNFSEVQAILTQDPWLRFMAEDPASCSPTSLCFVPTDASFQALSSDAQWALITRVCQAAAEQGVALDIKGHKASAPCFRFWGGPTIESTDLARALRQLANIYRHIQA